MSSISFFHAFSCRLVRFMRIISALYILVATIQRKKPTFIQDDDDDVGEVEHTYLFY